ncbi:unnamed protein product [Paramecium octaurelia]|uniref:Uncharacterized protein n=1 Tax=Paramecium octaurelia TaxID=43137 RepID=A0A8S1TFD1_PAROT|nr:unnamed protein product [Paramecium octaurelia]
MGYNIPYIHLRSLFDRNQEADIEGKEQSNKHNGEFGLNGQNYKVTEEVAVFGNKKISLLKLNNMSYEATRRKSFEYRYISFKITIIYESHVCSIN